MPSPRPAPRKKRAGTRQPRRERELSQWRGYGLIVNWLAGAILGACSLAECVRRLKSSRYTLAEAPRKRRLQAAPDIPCGLEVNT